jgi:hypothetical protein
MVTGKVMHRESVFNVTWPVVSTMGDVAVSVSVTG